MNNTSVIAPHDYPLKPYYLRLVEADLHEAMVLFGLMTLAEADWCANQRRVETQMFGVPALERHEARHMRKAAAFAIELLALEAYERDQAQ